MARDQLTSREIFSNNYITEIPKELPAIEEAARRDEVGGIQLGRTEGALLSWIVRLKNPQVAVEIGGLYGASASWILAGLGDGARLITVEKDPKCAELLSKHLQEHLKSGRLKVVVGDAEEELVKLPREWPIDLVFIDANKSAYADYLKWAEERMSPGGVLVADNTFLFGTMLQDSPEGVSPRMWNSMRNFNEHLKNSQAWSAVILPTTEGFTVAQRR